MGLFTYILKRNLFSWLFEVLPVALLCLQSAVAAFHQGDVDARARGDISFGGKEGGKLSSLLGGWRVIEWQGMDQFLEDLRFPAWKRALAARAGQSYVLQLKGGGLKGGSLDNTTLRIVTSDLRGKSELELPLSGRSVVAHDGDGGAEVARAARTLDDQTLEITETYARERDPYSVCRRTLTPDGRMLLEVRKRTPQGRWASMRAIAARIVDKAAHARVLGA